MVNKFQTEYCNSIRLLSYLSFNFSLNSCKIIKDKFFNLKSSPVLILPVKEDRLVNQLPSTAEKYFLKGILFAQSKYQPIALPIH